MTCWTTYYCGTHCQRDHWKEHKRHCTAPVRQTVEHVAIAVPDYQCFLKYQQYVSQRPDPDGVSIGICVLSQSYFLERFGQKQLLRTCMNLAKHGKPGVILIKVYGNPQ